MYETKRQKIERLKASQKRLKVGQSNTFNLGLQQQALRKGLLLRKPMVEDRRQKVVRLRENQRVERHLRSKRDKEERERRRVIDTLRKEQSQVKISNGERMNNLFFPRTKRRRR